MKRAINLARVSTPRQAELYSLDYQLEQMRHYAKDTGLTIIAEFKDDMTGRRLERDGLEEACLMLERDEADILITWKFDRLHRNYVNSVVLRERIRRAGKEIHYAQSRSVSGKTERQRLPEDLQYIMAEIEADDIVERTSQGRANKVAAGKWIGLNRPPYGYTTRGRGRDVQLVIDEEKAKNVRLIFRWYVRGDESHVPMSTKKIAEKLSAMNIPTPQDLIPSRQHMKRRGFGEWSRATIHKIIRQHAYGGTFYHFRHTVRNGRTVVNPDKSKWQGVPVPRIVDEDVFLAAQQKMDQGRELSKRGVVFDYLVGRRVWCECGYKMRSVSSGKEHRLKDGSITGYSWHYYRCPGRTSGTTHTCDMPPVNVKQLDNLVWKWVKTEIANPIILEKKLLEIQAEQELGGMGVAKRIDMLAEHKKSIEEELRRLGKLYAKGMPEGIVDQLISEQSHKLQLIDEEIRRLEVERETPLTSDVIATLVAFSTKFGEPLEAIGESFEAQRAMIDGLDVHVAIVRRNGEVWADMKSILQPEVFSVALLYVPD